MQLAGRLRDTTLGDLLGTLYRDRVSGIVELTETEGPRAGRAHRIHLRTGCVVAVETSADVPRIGDILRGRGIVDDTQHRKLTLRLAQSKGRLTGELLVEDRVLSPDIVDAALRHQLRARLNALYRIADAKVRFHVMGVRPRGGTEVPLSVREVLGGRPRAREQRRTAGTERAVSAPAGDGARARALSLLGLSEGASPTDVRRAFRVRASEAHPDRRADATPSERRSLETHFAALSAAYHQLLD